MIKLRQSDEFKAWFDRQRDRQASTKIKIRIDRFQLDNPGDVKSVGGAVSEMRIDYGPGYRLYFT